MNKLLILFAILFFASCGATPQDPTPSGDAVKQKPGETARGQPSGIDVKVTQNGKLLADWKAASETTGVGALLTRDDLSIELISPDQKWVLSISVSGVKTGVYRLAALREAGK